MAIIFQLWAECADATRAQRFADHFSRLKVTVTTGTTFALEVVAESSVGAYVWSPGLSRRGILTVRDAIETTEVGIRLLHRLLTAPDFRYAHVGWEAGNIPMAELAGCLTHLAGGDKLLGLHCVIDDELWTDFGRPGDVRPFRSGYRWDPYRGEEYRPLGSQDHQELWKLREQLLPP
jgi:hypothetical protein